MPLRIAAALLCASLYAWGTTSPAFGQSCGPQPVPDPGCVIGPCAGGEWVQECHYDDLVECGPKPLPSAGCIVGSCKNGEWQKFCGNYYAPDCGPKPEYPPVGCRVGACVEGVWEVICTEPAPVLPLD